MLEARSIKPRELPYLETLEKPMQNGRKIRSTVLFALIFTVIGGARAHANTLYVTLTNPDQVGAPGSVIQYFGTLTNNGSSTVYLNSDSLNIGGLPADFILDDLFLDNVPISLDGGASSGPIELFDVMVTSPFPDTPAVYTGTYDLLGGVDGPASDLLTDPAVQFSVAVATPEPTAWSLASAALLVMAGWRRRAGRSRP
jgi:hypothetical protein